MTVTLVPAPGANLHELRRLIAASLPAVAVDDMPANADWLDEPGMRWSPKRKAMLLVAIADGAVDLADVMRVHALSPEELLGWARDLALGGQRALRSTKLQQVGEVRS